MCYCTVAVSIRSYLATEAAVESDVQREVLPTECRRYRAEEVGLCRTYYLYLAATLLVADAVIVVPIEEDVAILVACRSDITHKQAVLATYLSYRTNAEVVCVNLTLEVEVVYARIERNDLTAVACVVKLRSHCQSPL